MASAATRGNPVRRFAVAVAAMMAVGAFAGAQAVWARSGSSKALFTGDGFFYYCYLPSLFADGDLDLTNQDESVTDRAYGMPSLDDRYGAVVPSTGRAGNVFAIGSAVLWVPFFAMACYSLWLATGGLGLPGIAATRARMGIVTGRAPKRIGEK